MNILVISNIFPPEVLGGYELICSGVARALCARGHSVTVLTSGARGKEDGDVAIDRRLEFTNIYEGEIDATDQILARAINENNAKIIYEQVSQSKCDVVLAFNLLGLGGLQIVDTLNFCEVPWVWYLADSVPGQLMSHLPAELLDLFECSATRTFACDNAIFMSRRLRMDDRLVGRRLGAVMDVRRRHGESGSQSAADGRQHPNWNDTARYLVVR